MRDWWRGQELATQRRINGAIQEGVSLGEGMDAIRLRLDGTQAMRKADGLVEISRREAEAIVRTGVMAVSGQARLETINQNESLIKAVQHVSTLDHRTTRQCRSRDGLRWKIPGYAPIGHDKHFRRPPIHWQCRSTLVPITYSWEELAARGIDGSAAQEEPEHATGRSVEFEAAFRRRLKAQGFSDAQIAEIRANTRASMDGQVAADQTHDEWLRSKGDSFARRALGPGRFKLFKEGKITLRDLTDQDNRVLTIAQLEAAVRSRSGHAVETER